MSAPHPGARTDRAHVVAGALAVAAAALILGCVANTTTTTPAPAQSASVASTSGGPYVAASSPEQAGEYLTTLGGCNDCHTPQWAETNGNVPAANRFVGSPVGYRGPWGTSYAANLRLLTQRITEDQWVDILKTAAHGHGDPPMPWMNTRQMSDQDLRTIYRYIHSLGPAGQRTPRGVPPGQEPTTPYINFVPVQPGGH
jgi:cytochrome c553